MPKILVIEANKQIQKTYQSLLKEKCGAEVFVVNDVSRARDFLFKGQVQPCVDMVIFGISGDMSQYPQLAEDIRKKFWKSDINVPVLANPSKQDGIGAFLIYGQDSLFRQLKAAQPGDSVVCEALMNCGASAGFQGREQKTVRQDGWFSGLYRRGLRHLRLGGGA